MGWEWWVLLGLLWLVTLMVAYHLGMRDQLIHDSRNLQAAIKQRDQRRLRGVTF